MPESIKQRVNPVFRETDSRKLFEAVLADLNAIKVFLGGMLNGSATFDAANLVDGAGTTTTVTVTGAVLTDYVIVSHGVDLQGITVTAWVSAADTVSVRFQNETGGAIDLASSTLRALVLPRALFNVPLTTLNLTA